MFDLKGLSTSKRLEVRQPILTNEDLEKIRVIGDIADNQFSAKTLDITYNADKGAEGMEGALAELCERAEKAVLDGYNIIILSDRMINRSRIAIPALLATAAVHHHLIRKGLRTSVGLVVETGEAREVHHFCVLAGFGRRSHQPLPCLRNPSFHAHGNGLPEEVDQDEVVERYIKSIDKGILKVMSKMGISTYQSYCGAQIFDAVGLSSEFVEKYFFGTATMIEGIGLSAVAEETVQRHSEAFGDVAILRRSLDVGGEYAYRIRGENHMWTPDSIANLQHAVRSKLPEMYRTFAKEVNQESGRFAIRGHFRIKNAEEIGRSEIDISKVEPAENIVKRFVTGAMSFGSISKEAHSSLGRRHEQDWRQVQHR